MEKEAMLSMTIKKTKNYRSNLIFKAKITLKLLCILVTAPSPPHPQIGVGY